MDFITILGFAAAIFGITIIAKGVRIVQQGQVMVIERFGSFSRILNSGLNIIVPIIDAPRTTYWIANGQIIPTEKIDLRESVMDVPEQAVITKDNVSIMIDALLYVQITDPKKAVYEIANLPLSVAQLAQTSLRNVIGEMDLDQSLVSRDQINSKLKLVLDEATDKWGTKVNRVEIKNITPPREIQQAMEKQMQAERERRAKVLEAEGDKQARIARSEGMQQEQINISSGEKESQILRATGEAEAIIQVAQAKKRAIEEIKLAMGSNAELAVRYLIATHYLNAFEGFTQGDGDKVFVPYEATSSLGALGSIKEILSGAAPTGVGKA